MEENPHISKKTGTKGENEEKAEKPFALLPLAGQVGFMIAIPLVLLVFAGRYVDKALHTSPIFLLVGTLTAALISLIIVYKKLAIYLR